MKKLYLIGGTKGVGKTSMPDIENETTGQCLSGWGLVLGHASILGNFGNKKGGIGEHNISPKRAAELIAEM